MRIFVVLTAAVSLMVAAPPQKRQAPASPRAYRPLVRVAQATPQTRSQATPQTRPQATTQTRPQGKPQSTPQAKSAPRYRTWSGNRYRQPVRRWTPVRRPAYNYQMQPTVDRYRDIQLALVEKGHFSGEVNGIWGQDSTEALKQFQTEQNLPGEGRLNSLSLIALGLGPKREPMPATPPLAQPQPVPPAAAQAELPKADNQR